MRFSKSQNVDFIDDKFCCQDNDILYFVFYKDEPWIGITILSSKALKKRKGFEHLLFSKETVLELRDYFSHPYNKIGYFECNCTSEILRIVYEDGFFYLDIFDNYALKLKSGIKTSTSFHERDVPELKRVLNNMLSKMRM